MAERRQSHRLHVILDVPLQAQLAQFEREHNLTTSQTVRLLLAEALRPANLPSDAVWRKQAFREGVLAGAGALKRRLNDAMMAALNDIDEVAHGQD